ncbi:MAG: GGDEF domain-containing protein [Solibacillus sp.]
MFSNLEKSRRNIIYLLAGVVTLVFVMNITSVSNMDILTILDFTFVTMIAACYPIKINNVKRMHVYWLVIPLLYLYGPMAMLLFYQLAIMIFLFFSRTKEGNYTHYPVYAFVFFVGPFLSYYVMVMLGFEFVEQSFLQMIFVNGLFYSIFLVFSGLIFMLIQKKSAVSLAKKELALTELLYGVVFILLGTVLYASIEMYGQISLIGALLCYLMVASVSRNYDETKQKSKTLENIVDLQLKYNEYETQQQLTKEFLRKVQAVTGAKQISIVHEVEMGFMFKNDQLQRNYVKRCQYEMLQHIFAENRIRYVEKRAYSQIEATFDDDEKIESLLALPISDTDQPSMLVLESEKCFAFEKGQIELCKLLVTAYQNALQQMNDMEAVMYKSERCALTGLYNYGYLTERLQDMELQLQQGKLACISTIILDIDHFKRLNDIYGHENGNLILKEFATGLRTLVDERYVLARYGGEEFVVLLPNISSNEAVKIAEHYRQRIEQLSFQVFVLEQQMKKQETVQITVSIGVASIPEHTDNSMDLISFADKALYVGAKQAGRNRVAVFKESLSY